MSKVAVLSYYTSWVDGCLLPVEQGVNMAFKQLEEGIQNVVKDYNHKQNQQLEDLIHII
jgi:hypothetical protein